MFSSLYVCTVGCSFLYSIVWRAKDLQWSNVSFPSGGTKILSLGKGQHRLPFCRICCTDLGSFRYFPLFQQFFHAVVVLTVIIVVVVAVGGSNPTCFNGADGSITLSASGGSGTGYMYSVRTRSISRLFICAYCFPLGEWWLILCGQFDYESPSRGLYSDCHG